MPNEVSAEVVGTDNSSIYENASNEQSFDNMEDFPEDMEGQMEETQGEDWSQKPASKEGKKEGQDIKRLSDSDEDGDTPDAPEKKSTEKPESDDDKETDDAKLARKDGEKEDELPPSDSSSKLRVRLGDQLYGLPEDASLRVKVDGSYQDVPVGDLIKNYAGKTAWDKKFTELGNEKKQFTQQQAKFQERETFMNNLFEEVQAIAKDPTKDPNLIAYKIVDMLGLDAQDLNERVMEANLEELAKLLDMSDVERENYKLKKRVEYMKSRTEARKAQDNTALEKQTFRQKVDGLRQKGGVSEDQYVEALNELDELYQGTDTQLTPEFVIEYAALKPHLEKAKQIVLPYREYIGEGKLPTYINEISRLMKDSGITEAEVVAELKSKLVLPEKSLKDLGAKLKGDKRGDKTEKTETAEKERMSFDDLFD